MIFVFKGYLDTVLKQRELDFARDVPYRRILIVDREKISEAAGRSQRTCSRDVPIDLEHGH